MKKRQGQQTLFVRLRRKILGLSFVFFLAACTTGSQKISSGDVRSGMSKGELRTALSMTYPSEDPFLTSGISKMFYNENKEIIYGSAQTVFYVFRNVTKPIKCGWICDYGNGYLEKWFYSYSDAANYITKKKTPKVKAKKKIITKDKDVVDNLNKLIEEYQSGKISKEEFTSKKAEILK